MGVIETKDSQSNTVWMNHVKYSKLLKVRTFESKNPRGCSMQTYLEVRTRGSVWGCVSLFFAEKQQKQSI